MQSGAKWCTFGFHAKPVRLRSGQARERHEVPGQVEGTSDDKRFRGRHPIPQTTLDSAYAYIPEGSSPPFRTIYSCIDGGTVQKRPVLTIAASALLLAFSGCHKDQQPVEGPSPVGVGYAADVDIDLPQTPNVKQQDKVYHGHKAIWKSKHQDPFVICFQTSSPCEEGAKIHDRGGKAECKISSSATPTSYTYDVGPGPDCPKFVEPKSNYI